MLRPDPYASDEDWIAAGFPVPGPNANYAVACARVAAPFTIWVEHADGVIGYVRFELSALTGVFEVLNDAAQFAQVFVDNGVVRWPNDLDLAPDNMHRHLAAFGEWVIQ